MTSAADAVRVASGSGACARCSATLAIAFPGLGAPTGRDSPSPGRRFVAPAAQDRPLVHVVHAELNFARQEHAPCHARGCTDRLSKIEESQSLVRPKPKRTRR